MNKLPEYFLTYLRKECPETLFEIDDESIKILFEYFANKMTDTSIYDSEMHTYDIHNSLRMHEVVKQLISNEFEQKTFKEKLGRLFEEHDIPYAKNVFIDEFGVVRYQKQLNCNKIDFIMGVPPEEGSSITKCNAVSCRNDCHKLFLNDAWSLKEISRPNLFILITPLKEYPDPQSFTICLQRMLVSTGEKEYKDFVYDLDFLMRLLDKKKR